MINKKIKSIKNNKGKNKNAIVFSYVDKETDDDNNTKSLNLRLIVQLCSELLPPYLTGVTNILYMT